MQAENFRLAGRCGGGIFPADSVFGKRVGAEVLARFVDGCCLVLGEGRAARRLCCGAEFFQRAALFMESRWVLRLLPALSMDAACCLRMEGRCGGFAAGWNPSDGCAATSLSQGRLWAPAGGAFWGKRASAEALARFLMGAAWCFAMEGWRGGFAAERNFSSGRRFLWKACGFFGACPLC